MHTTTSEARGSRPLVCVIDGDDLVRTRLEAIIRTLDLDVVAYASAEEFLAGVQTGRADCLISEVELRGISGIELQMHLQDAGIACPVILISHEGDIATAVNAMQLGAFDFVEKPFMNRVILNLVRHALQLPS